MKIIVTVVNDVEVEIPNNFNRGEYNEHLVEKLVKMGIGEEYPDNYRDAKRNVPYITAISNENEEPFYEV